MLLRPSSFFKKIHFDNFLNRTSSKGGWFYRRESKIRSMHDLKVQFFFSFYQIKGGGQWTWWCTCIWSKQRWYVTCWHNMSPVRVTQRNFNFVSLARRPMSRGPIGPYINPEPPTYMPLCLTVSKRLLLFFFVSLSIISVGLNLIAYYLGTHRPRRCRPPRWWCLLISRCKSDCCGRPLLPVGV